MQFKSLDFDSFRIKSAGIGVDWVQVLPLTITSFSRSVLFGAIFILTHRDWIKTKVLLLRIYVCICHLFTQFITDCCLPFLRPPRLAPAICGRKCFEMFCHVNNCCYKCFFFWRGGGWGVGGLFTWREEDPSTRKIREGGKTKIYCICY